MKRRDFLSTTIGGVNTGLVLGAPSLLTCYHDVAIQVSDDPEFASGVTTIYNNDYDNSSQLGVGKDRPYVESRFGLLVNGHGVKGRHVRLYSNGSTWSMLNCYTEVEVFGRPG